jgi:hypothetical protein
MKHIFCVAIGLVTGGFFATSALACSPCEVIALTDYKYQEIELCEDNSAMKIAPRTFPHYSFQEVPPPPQAKAKFLDSLRDWPVVHRANDPVLYKF